MPICRGRYALSLLVAATLASGLAQAAQTQQAAPVDPDQIKLDRAIQGLKDEVINFNRDAQNVEDDVNFPLSQRVNIYFGIKVNALLIKTLSVSVDDKPAYTYNYSDAEARALLNSEGLHRVMRASLEQGAHRLSVDYTAQFADAKPDDPPVSGHYEAIFDKRAQGAELELKLSRTSRLEKPQMRLLERKLAAADEPVPPPTKNKLRRRRVILP